MAVRRPIRAREVKCLRRKAPIPLSPCAARGPKRQRTELRRGAPQASACASPPCATPRSPPRATPSTMPSSIRADTTQPTHTPMSAALRHLGRVDWASAPGSVSALATAMVASNATNAPSRRGGPRSRVARATEDSETRRRSPASRVRSCRRRGRHAGQPVRRVAERPTEGRLRDHERGGECRPDEHRVSYPDEGHDGERPTRREDAVEAMIRPLEQEAVTERLQR